jgi:hypothetical protein
MACCVLAAMLVGRLLRLLVFVGRKLSSRRRNLASSQAHHPSPEIVFRPSEANLTTSGPAHGRT